MKEYLASKGADAEEDDDDEAWEAAFNNAEPLDNTW